MSGNPEGRDQPKIKDETATTLSGSEQRTAASDAVVQQIRHYLGADLDQRTDQTIRELSHPASEVEKSTPGHQIETTDVDGVCVVRFTQRKMLDATAIEKLGKELFDLIETKGQKRILLNFNNVEFLSSLALNKLIILDRKTKRYAATLRLCQLRPEIYEVFEITRLHECFDIRDGEKEALKDL